jgi:hypothetical protein
VVCKVYIIAKKAFRKYVWFMGLHLAIPVLIRISFRTIAADAMPLLLQFEVDSLIDLIPTGCGILWLAGFSFDACWEEAALTVCCKFYALRLMATVTFATFILKGDIK